MNYERIYNQLITKRVATPAIKPRERHHIVMRSMGGSDDEENLVYLTCREHYIAHRLLHKIHKSTKTVFALWRMSNNDSTYVITGRKYQTMRLLYREAMSTNNKRLIGDRNSQYGTRWISNLLLQQNRKISKDSVIPEGWVIGRSVWCKKPPAQCRVWITNGINNSVLTRYDQNIPDGWRLGRTDKPFSLEVRERISKRTRSSNIRRRGIKYNKSR